MKRQGRSGSGSPTSVRSLRAHPDFADFGRMIVRSAFAQLRYSPLLLDRRARRHGRDVSRAAAARRCSRHGAAQAAGIVAWALMALAFAPDASPLSAAGDRRPRACPPSPPPIRSSRSNPRCSTGVGAAAIGRAAIRPRRAGWRRDDLAAEARSGKGHRDENFPVASWLVGPQHRGRSWPSTASPAPPTTSPTTRRSTADEKLALLDRLGDALSGRGAGDPEAEPLRLALAERGLAPRHALDLLEAFRLDVTKRRYASWHELMDYCRLSAAPVGRFVLDVHGEDHSDVAGVRSALRGAAGDQPPAGLRRGLSPARPRLPACRTCSPRTAPRSRCSPRPDLRRAAAAPPSHDLAARTEALLARSGAARRRGRRTCGSRSRSRRSRRSPSIWLAGSATRDPLERTACISARRPPPRRRARRAAGLARLIACRGDDGHVRA